MVGSEYDVLKMFPNIAEKTECPMDVKGYFIVSGVERVVIPQARMRRDHGRLFLFINVNSKKYSYS